MCAMSDVVIPPQSMRQWRSMQRCRSGPKVANRGTGVRETEEWFSRIRASLATSRGAKWCDRIRSGAAEQRNSRISAVTVGQEGEYRARRRGRSDSFEFVRKLVAAL